MGGKIAGIKPHFYVNVHQTMYATIAIVFLTAYVFDFKGVRTDLNRAVTAYVRR